LAWAQVPEYIYPTDSVPDYGAILVPNVDNVRTDFLIQTIMKQGKAVLLTGEQGTAKTVMIRVRPGDPNTRAVLVVVVVVVVVVAPVCSSSDCKCVLVLNCFYR